VVNRVIGSRRSKIVFTLLIGMSILIAYLWGRTDRQDNSTGVGTSQPKSIDYGARISIPLVPRPSKRDTNVAGGRPATYAAYLEDKGCYDLKDTRTSIAEELDDLRSHLAQSKPSDRWTLEKLLHEKEQQLAETTACLRGRESITKKDLNLLLASAARSGNVDAQVAYAQDPQIDAFHRIDNLRELREWRDTAVHYLDSAINAGNLDAMLAMAEASDPLHCGASNEAICADMLKNVVAEDAKTSYTYYYLALITNAGASPPWVSTELGALEKVLTPPEVEEAKAKANLMLRRE